MLQFYYYYSCKYFMCGGYVALCGMLLFIIFIILIVIVCRGQRHDSYLYRVV